ncbi:MULTISPECIES: carboxymuconolactone decarboxylase family protein [unclassified Bacillus (in: firmicutes)]|uniref:carboxymuconolactone decarboxylase family protein n=1 Tax=unclassified Bacillus (in: firmicutes) TaxID=185979 RepID=UPI0008E245AC|nr:MULTISPECIES: carboxymuconolactone decarboxylase family protein [unclassified Bacillus (in: firmicutes)]SFB08368.1 Alkylhydroperoxidase family enzyme, contains CxxC motif [Bacillus sp. UNCCL13]SFQ87091.1 Alkylhydroperoxidase family enzyme, contains CxxC motif [Bacillus sp. cl95]
MARIKESEYGKTPFQKLLGHNKKVMEAWTVLGESLEGDELLSSILKEQVRRTLAQSNGCEYCKAKGKPDPHLYDEKTSLAVGFAEVFLKQKGDISEETFKILKEEFSEGEISELCAFICFTTAQQYYGAMMKLEEVQSGE